MKNINNYVLQFVLGFLGYMFMYFAFPEIEYLKRMSLIASWVCFYGFMKIVEWTDYNK